jgi:IclR family transcriptional regulator, pca regulon regulatory protein
MGRVLLAGLPEKDARAILERSHLHKITAHTKAHIDLLMAEVARARKTGWSLVQQENRTGGLRVVSRCVKDQRGGTRAAVSISFNMSRFDKKHALEKSLPRLLQAAQELSRLED